MTSIAKFSYQKLPHSAWFEDEDDFLLRERVIGSLKSWPKVRKVHIKRRFLRVKIPSLRRFLRRKSPAFFATWAKVLKGLRQSRSHFGDLFAGNYLFMQITPTPFKCGDKYLKDLNGIPYRCSIPGISQ